jgi:hypothetical protein
MPDVCFDLSAAVQQGAGISRYERELTSRLVSYQPSTVSRQSDDDFSYSYFYTSPTPEVKNPLPPELAA